MSLNSERNPAEYFTVFGAAYIPEHRGEHCNDGHRRSFDEVASEQRERSLKQAERSFKRSELGAASLWLLFYVAVIGISVPTSAAASKWVEIAAVAVK